MRFTTLLFAVMPLWAQTNGPEALAARMLERLDSVSWNAPYRGGSSCRQFSDASQGAVYSAPSDWSWHCNQTSAEISVETYYYAFVSTPLLLRTDIGLTEPVQNSSAAARQLIEAKLTSRFGAPSPAPPLYPISPGGGTRALLWRTDSADLLLFDGPFYLSPLRPRTGVRLIAIDSPLRGAIQDDTKMRELFDSLLQQPAQTRLAQELGPLYGTANPTINDVLRLLRAVQNALENRAAGMLLRADALLFDVSVALGDERHQKEAESARRQLAAFGVRLGPQRKDGLEYDHDLLQEAWRKYPDTEWGQQAFLSLEDFGWNPSFDGYSCPQNPDYFRDVISRGEAFLRKYPRSPVYVQVLFGVATAYETWWSVSQAPANDENWGHYPRREENNRGKDSARRNAIARYEEIERLSPGSAYALFAARHLPRLRLDLDTGFRRWFCIGD